VSSFWFAAISDQSSNLTFAAMDTTSGALARALHLLSTHQDIQIKLRQEILDARSCGKLEYDELVGLPYLDAVIRETLRLSVHSFRVNALPIKHCLVIRPFPR
jgi:cytochrome P450